MEKRIARQRFDAEREVEALGLPKAFAEVLTASRKQLSPRLFRGLLEGLRALRNRIDYNALFGEIGASPEPKREPRTPQESMNRLRALLPSESVSLLDAAREKRLAEVRRALAAAETRLDLLAWNLLGMADAWCVVEPSLDRERLYRALAPFPSRRGPTAVNYDASLVAEAQAVILRERPSWGKRGANEKISEALGIDPRTVERLIRAGRQNT